MIDGWIKLRRKLPAPAGMNDAERAVWDANNGEQTQCLLVPTYTGIQKRGWIKALAGEGDGRSWHEQHPEALVWFPDDSERGGALYEWMAAEGAWKEVLDDTLEVVSND